MIMRLGCTFLAFLFSALCHAQSDSSTDDILTTQKFEEGLYRSFESFQHNAPDVVAGYTIQEDTGIYKHVFVLDTRKKRATSFYGFSDGEDLFVNARIYTSDVNYYVRVQLLGPISYFDDEEDKHHAASNKRAVSKITRRARPARSSDEKDDSKISKTGWIIFFGDNDGQAYLFDKENLLSIFRTSNKAMYQRLKGEPGDNFEMLMRYVDEFNKLPIVKNKR